jgi:hypothetical protein
LGMLYVDLKEEVVVLGMALGPARWVRRMEVAMERMLERMMGMAIVRMVTVIVSVKMATEEMKRVKVRARAKQQRT